jgi:hypothetical protein
LVVACKRNWTNRQKLREEKKVAAGLLERRDWENLVEKCHIKVVHNLINPT